MSARDAVGAAPNDADVVRHGATDKLVFELLCPWLFSTDYLADHRNVESLSFLERVEVKAGDLWLNQYLAHRTFGVGPDHRADPGARRN
ncbi:hypothetical protein ACFT1A_29405 [Rhodococcus sp. NPDC057135]|uniref:hypothetical protein n=1 Tax=Rhodococcus sp. NPDC057135 TaxID=3346028 RepID=UPI003633063E